MFNLVDRAKTWKGAAGSTTAFTTHVPGSLVHGGQATVSDQSQPTQVHYNTKAAPSVAFASGNPYLDRPLPAPPLERLTMLERPSTSGGSSSKNQAGSDFSKFNKFDKRVSRDDFYLSMKPKAGTGLRQPQYATFRGPLPTPEGSPRSKGSSRPAIPIVRMPTPDSMEDVSAPIGMALGSPTHKPENWGAWSPQQTLRPEPVQTVHPASPLSSVESVDAHDMPKEKKQPGRRKLFGLFSRRNTDHSQTTVPISDPGQKSPETRSRPGRSNTVGGPKHKPIVIRSQTMPYENEQLSNANMPGLRNRNPSVDTYGSSNPHERSTSNFGSIPILLETPAQSTSPMPSLLKVDIPKSNLERYSVMFQGVLETQPSTSSALLARRQATVKELRKLNNAVIAEEDERLVRPRRATSPQPIAQSPAFTLFPPTPPGRQSSQQVSHSQPRPVRANTSPLPAPPQNLPSQPLQAPTKEPNAAHHHVGRMAIPTVPKVKPQLTPVHGFNFGPDQSGIVLESPSDLESPILTPEITRTNIAKPKFREPQWQIIEPPTHTASTSSSDTSSRKRSPSSASSAQTHVTKPSFDMDEPDNINISRDPVEISIARQISISRQQRKLLQPLQTSFAARTSPRGSPAVPRIAMGKNERLAETKIGTPTIVTPDETFDGQLLQNRKSSRVVVED